MTVGEKRCFICDELKSLTEFHKHKSREDGFRSDCKECRKLDRKKDWCSVEQRCTICSEVKPNTLEFFQRDKRFQKGNRRVCKTECKVCVAKRMRYHHLRRTYGISEIQVVKLHEKQNGICAICKEKPKRLVIDHNHITSDVRELLCDGCNSGLGMFKENIEFLKSAIEYIIKHNNNNNDK